MIEVKGALPLETGSCRVIAEAGVNHNNDLGIAKDLVREAAAAGAWAIKFQLYKAGELAVRDSPKYWTDDSGTTSQHESFSGSDHLGYDDYFEIADECRVNDIIFFATPFDLAAIETLEQIGAPMYKLASGDITHRPLIEAVCATGKPLLLSTGAATEAEISEAVSWTGYGPDKLCLLACTLTYPTPDVDGNFARIESLRGRFGPYLVGMSDHTIGAAGGWMTAALGGVCIEKHYTLDKTMPDVPDHSMSIEPDELAELVKACDRGSRLRGVGDLEPVESELPARQGARRSVVLAKNLLDGHVLAMDDLAFKRPGTGIAPAMAGDLIGRRLVADLEADHALELTDLA